MKKPFDRKLWKQYDKLGRKWVKTICPEGFILKDNINRTGVDLLIYHKGKLVGYIEPEVKAVWKSKFKYDTVHLPARKVKYCGLKNPTLFIIFRSDGKEYFCLWDRIVLKSHLKEVPNKYVKEKEEFYDIKINQSGIYSNITEAFKEKFNF